MNLLQRIAGQRKPEARSADLSWLAQSFGYGGHAYPFGVNQTLVGNRTMPIGSTFNGYTAALKACPPAFAAEYVRSLVISQARFVFRNRRFTSTPGRIFTNSALGILERPWANGTTGELLTAMEWHAGVAGNAYVRNLGSRLRVLNPSWMTVMLGSEEDPNDALNAADAELVGYLYQPGGPGSSNRPQTFLPGEIAHWSPLPDPENTFVGMSWVTPAVREIQGDIATADHKLKFFENGATPNLVVKGIPASSQEEFDRLVDLMENDHAGATNAYKTLYLVAGADATVVGANLQQIDFNATQAQGETRISILSRVPAPILGASEGLKGSALNAGNFAQARRNFADGWLYPSLQSVASALSSIVNVPPDAELWYDTTDMPFIRDDATDRASIQTQQATTITQYVKEGFTAESAIAAVEANDVSKLVHTGLISVQLQPPGAGLEPGEGSPDPDMADEGQPSDNQDMPMSTNGSGNG